MLTVQDVLERKGTQVATIGREDSVLTAARLMNEKRIGALVVTDGDRAVGIFTERDVMNRVVAAQRDPAAVKVGDVMTSPMACCRRSTTLEACRATMTARKIRHLPVVEEGRLHGIISIGDILAAQSDEQQHTIEVLHEYLHGRH